VGPLLVLLCASAALEAAPVTIDVGPGVIAAARALGPEVVFFTAKGRPLANLGQLREAVAEVGSGDVARAKEIQALLRAGGVNVGGGAVDLMRLYGPHHFATLFSAHPHLRLFIVQAREDGREQAIVSQGGGVRLLLRGRDQTIGEVASKPLRAESAAPFVTSFGPLLGAELAATARQRQFDAQDGVRVDTRQARKGNTFVVLHLERDFSAGAGVVSFLFGSGIIVKPEFEQLVLAYPDHRTYTPTAINANGKLVDLAYEVPTVLARGLSLRDGDVQIALAPLLAARTAAGE
jgi:hypothetical protein